MAKKIPPIDPEQPAFIRVPVKAIPLIIDLLRREGLESEADAAETFTEYYTNPDLNALRERWIDHAGGKDGQIEFDSDSTISQSSEEGEYVLGWVWVDGPLPCQLCDTELESRPPLSGHLDDEFLGYYCRNASCAFHQHEQECICLEDEGELGVLCNCRALHGSQCPRLYTTRECTCGGSTKKTEDIP